MSAERSANVVQMPGQSLMAGLDEYIKERVKAEIKALGIGAVKPKRRELRVKAGFVGLRDLAIAAQVSATWISMLERGRIGHPGARSRAALERLCATLNVTPYEYISALTEG